VDEKSTTSPAKYSINTRCIQNQIENENKQRILKDLPEKVKVHFKHNFYATS
jgi:hypothetical protein